MNEEEIAKILTTDSFTRRNFRGVFAKDEFTIFSNLNSHQTFIVNTDNSNQPGSHWVAFQFSGDYSCEYFDSYGFPPSFYGFDNVLKSYKIYMSNKRIQGYKSSVCGQYCVLFLLLRGRGYSYHDFMSFFHKNPAVNDHATNNTLVIYVRKYGFENLINLVVHDDDFLKQYDVSRPYCVFD